jgi:hypothetical protein
MTKRKKQCARTRNLWFRVFIVLLALFSLTTFKLFMHQATFLDHPNVSSSSAALPHLEKSVLNRSDEGWDSTTTDSVSQPLNTEPVKNKDPSSEPIKQNVTDGKEKAIKEKKTYSRLPAFRSVDVDLTIPKPIFVASLPKSGTTSIQKYFECGGQKAGHLQAMVNGTLVRNGPCMEQNIKDGRPPFEGCGDFDVWTDTGYVDINPAHCYYPAIEGLEEIHRWYPNSTLMLAIRDTKTWQKTASEWYGLTERWKDCGLLGFTNTSAKAVQDFYEWHTEQVREFARNHPSMTFIEVALEDPNTPLILEKWTGVPASCFAKCKSKDYKYCKPHSIAPS